jgi:hypothetical protein
VCEHVTYSLAYSVPKLTVMDDHWQMRPELDDVLQSLFLNGYSVSSLINDILAHGCNREDRRIKLLREGTERDAADICARLLSHNPASSSVSAWALRVAQSTLQSKMENIIRKEHGTDHDPLSLRNNNVLSPGLSSGIAWESTDGSGIVFNFGGAQCTYSSSSVGTATSIEL